MNAMESLYPEIHLLCCPITNGLNTTLTQAGFDRLCKHHRRNKPWIRDSLYLVSGQNMFSRCKACKGKDRPAELKLFGE